MPKITLYEHFNHTGQSTEITQPTPHLTQFNDQASSCKVESGIWILYTDSNYTGAATILKPGDYFQPSFMGLNNDTLSSLRPLPQTGIALFPRPQYSGGMLTLDNNHPNLFELGYNDMIASIIILSGNWNMYADINYSGEIWSLGIGCYPTAASSGFRDKAISSIALTPASAPAQPVAQPASPKEEEEEAEVDEHLVDHYHYVDEREVYKILKAHLSQDDVEELCFVLGVEYDDLPGRGRKGKIRELIKYYKGIAIKKLVTEAKGLKPSLEIELFRLELHEILKEHLSQEELKTLCTSLEITYDDLDGSDYQDKLTDLVRYYSDITLEQLMSQATALKQAVDKALGKLALPGFLAKED